MVLPAAVKVKKYGSCRAEMSFNDVTSCSEKLAERKNSVP
jgi:hypothetical protein